MAHRKFNAIFSEYLFASENLSSAPSTPPRNNQRPSVATLKIRCQKTMGQEWLNELATEAKSGLWSNAAAKVRGTTREWGETRISCSKYQPLLGIS